MKKLFLHHAYAVCIFLFPVFARSEFYDWLADLLFWTELIPTDFCFLFGLGFRVSQERRPDFPPVSWLWSLVPKITFLVGDFLFLR
jgi:hypothetical protein